jgi:hypothetical protein
MIIATDYGLANQGIGIGFLVRAIDISFHSVQTGSGTHPIKWVLKALSRGMKRTTNLHSMSRIGMRGAITPLPHISSYHGA